MVVHSSESLNGQNFGDDFPIAKTTRGFPGLEQGPLRLWGLRTSPRSKAPGKNLQLAEAP